MSVFTIAAGITSRPHSVPAGAVVKVSPGVGASAIVEYTKESHVGITNGVAQWLPWPKGAVTAETSDRAYNAVNVRVTAVGADASLDVNGAPTAAELAAHRGDWGASAQVTVDGQGNLTGITSSSGNLVLTQLTSMTKWRKALAQMRDGTRNARLMLLGDSTTVGSGSGGANYTGANGRAKNYVVKLADLINKYRAPASAHALVGAGNASPYTVFDTRVTAGAGWAPTPIGAALGGTVYGNTTTNNALTFTPAGPVDTFVIWYAKNTSLATFDASIDGGAVTQTVAAGTKGVGSVTLTAGSVGTHTLSIARSTGTSGACYPLMIQAYDSTQKQIEVWGAGWSGSRVADQAIAANPWDVLNVIPTFAPDLTLIMLTINDANNGTSLASYKAGMQQLIDAAKATGDVVLMSGVPSAATTTSLGVQQLYIDAVRDLAITNGLLFIDNWRRFGSYEAMNALAFYTDSLHPSSVGYSDLAASIYSPLSRQI